MRIKSKRNLNVYIVCIIVLILIFLSGYFFNKFYVLYEKKTNFNIINGSVDDSEKYYFAYYVNDNSTREMPNKDSGLTLDAEKSNCNNGVTVSWDDDNWHAILDYSTYVVNDTTRTKCTLYFKKKSVSAVTRLENLVTGANPSSNEVYTVPDKTSDSCTYTFAYDGTADNNLRYVGSNPCNYVTFNGEEAGWRIIGILNTPEGQRLKLIRSSTLIFALPWDLRLNGDSEDSSSYQSSNDWTTSSLKKLLNEGAYYNRTTGTYVIDFNDLITLDFTNDGLLEEAKNQIDTVTWNLGRVSDWDKSSTDLASHFYSYERGKTVYTGSPTEWQGEVGLMYPSDYGYATGGGNTLSRQICLNTPIASWGDGPTVDESDCGFNDWLHGANWTLMTSSSSPNEVFRTSVGGNLELDATFNNRGFIKPTVYLKANVTILSGEGTKDNPYVLGLE